MKKARKHFPCFFGGMDAGGDRGRRYQAIIPAQYKTFLRAGGRPSRLPAKFSGKAPALAKAKGPGGGHAARHLAGGYPLEHAVGLARG